MQLDNTRIAVRERGVLELHDLAFQVMRAFFRPLLLTMAFGVVPLMALNHWLIGWMSYDLDYSESFPIRYLYNMAVLVIVEAPLASIFAIGYLGQIVFTDRPRIGQIAKDVIRLLPRIIWCDVIVRGIAVAWLLVLLLDPNTDSSLSVEVLLLPSLLLYCGLIRGMRPFINEITILERNPLKASNSTTMTIGRRSSSLHGPSSGMLFGRAMVGLVFAAPLVWAVYGSSLSVQGTFFNSWRQGRLIIELVYPLCLWLVATYFTIVRFLSYLDLRIRQEGWEVELLMRAESAKLTHRLS